MRTYAQEGGHAEAERRLIVEMFTGAFPVELAFAVTSRSEPSSTGWGERVGVLGYALRVLCGFKQRFR
jgi:hypothetical protein